MTKRRPALRMVGSVLALVATRGVGIALSFGIWILLASRFGASAITDAYFLGRRLTSAPTDAMGQVIKASYVPPLVQVMNEHGGATVRRLFWTHARRLLLLMAAVALVVAWLAPSVVDVLAPGFDDQARELSIRVLRALLIVVPVGVLIALVTALFNVTRRFGVPALIGELLPPAALVCALFFLVPPFDVVDLALVLSGATVVGLLLLLPGPSRIFRVDDREPVPVGLPSLELRSRALPFLIICGYGPLSMQIDLLFASTLGEGSVSILEYGNRLIQVIPRVLTGSMGVVMLTELSHRLLDSGVAGVRSGLVRAQRGGLFLILPVVTILIACSDPLIDVLLRRGNFDVEKARITADVMKVSGLAVVFSFLIAMFNTAIIVDANLPRMRILTWSATIAVSVRMLLDVTLAPTFGVLGIAAAFSATNVVLAGVLFFFVRRHWGALIAAADVKAVGAMLVACGLAAAAMVAVLWSWPADPDARLLTRLVRLVAVGGSGAIVYVVAALGLRVQELRYAGSLLRSRGETAEKNGERGARS